MAQRPKKRWKKDTEIDMLSRGLKRSNDHDRAVCRDVNSKKVVFLNKDGFQRPL